MAATKNAAATSGPPVNDCQFILSEILFHQLLHQQARYVSVNSLGLIIARLPAAKICISGAKAKIHREIPRTERMPITPFGSIPKLLPSHRDRSQAETEPCRFSDLRPFIHVLERSACLQPTVAGNVSDHRLLHTAAAEISCS